jgi:hypothetical protein
VQHEIPDLQRQDAQPQPRQIEYDTEAHTIALTGMNTLDLQPRGLAASQSSHPIAPEA